MMEKKPFKEPFSHSVSHDVALHVNYCIELYMIVQFTALLRIPSLTLTVEYKTLWLHLNLQLILEYSNVIELSIQLIKLNVNIPLLLAWVVLHSNATYWMEAEAQEWVSFPWCLVPGAQQLGTGPSSVWFAHHTAEWISSASSCVLLLKGSCPPVDFAELSAINMLCFKGLHRQMVHLEVSSQDFEFISKHTGVPSFEHKFANWFCYFDVVLMVPFISFLPEMNNSIFLDLLFFFLQACTPQLQLWLWVLEVPLLWQYLFQYCALCSQFFFYLYKDKNIFWITFSHITLGLLLCCVFFELHCSCTWTGVLNL